MQTGKRFTLTVPTLAIESVDDRRVAITLPVDAVIKVISGPTSQDNRMVNVLWEGRTLVMFAVDLKERGQEIRGVSASD
jgi:hypothetical protein